MSEIKDSALTQTLRPFYKIYIKLHKLRGYRHAATYRMLSKSWSDCHNAPVQQRLINPQAKAENYRYRQFCLKCNKQCRVFRRTKVY